LLDAATPNDTTHAQTLPFLTSQSVIPYEPDFKALLAAPGAALPALIRERALPAVGFNVFLVAAAALMLLSLLIWRLGRACCVLLCCRDGSASKRAAADPDAVLFTRAGIWRKVIMGIFWAAALILALYGLGSTRKARAAAGAAAAAPTLARADSLAAARPPPPPFSASAATTCQQPTA
jgi:hypothetical protein